MLDIGTGSGCIPIALKMERPKWELTAIDISDEALALARQNAGENEVDITFRKSDIRDWENFEDSNRYEIIISNPPYVRPDEKETLEKQVVEYEPSLALFSEDLETIYGSIIAWAEQALTDRGRLYLELHELHAGEISDLFDTARWQAEIRQDYAKKSRFIVAEKQN